jgi:hypothetical protein
MEFARDTLTAKMDTRACKAVFVLDAHHHTEPGRDYHVPKMAELVDLQQAGRDKARAMRDEVLAQIEAGELSVETVDEGYENGHADPGHNDPPPPPPPPVEEEPLPF